MVCSFLGTLIPLECTIAIRQKWMFSAPLLTGLGWILILLTPGPIEALLFTFGSLVTVATLISMYKREPKTHKASMVAGSLACL